MPGKFRALHLGLFERNHISGFLQCNQIWDHTFSEYSFGFRPNRSQHDAIRQYREYVRSGKRFVVDIDLSKFFDRVNHDRLMSRLAIRIKDKRVLLLIRSFLTAGVMLGCLVEASEEGTPQGSDGAGKSSLMHAIAGVKSFDGEIEFDNYIYRSPKEAEKVKGGIGFMPQGLGLILYEQLSVNEHLDFFADIRGIKQDSAFKVYRERLLHMAGLSDFTERQAGRLSGGMMQKLALICTLLHRPKLLLLDEPTTGVDPLSRMELWDILNDIITKEKTLCIVSTAYMAEATQMDRVLLFEDGEIIDKGKAGELIEKIRPFSYEAAPEPFENSITIHGYTYSLNPIELKPKEPTLDAVFFINFLKKYGSIPGISIVHKDRDEDVPATIMEAKGLTKRFGKFVANDHIDMELNKGEILGLLGANGAGKTTFIKMLLGLLSIDEGKLFLLGKKIKSADGRQVNLNGL